MKPVSIQFVEPRAWKFIWSFTALVVLATAVWTGWQVAQQRQLQQALQIEKDRLQAELSAASAPIPAVNNPRAASEQATLSLMRYDWNPVFDTLEKPALAHVRLVQFTLDAETGEARLEYALKDMAEGAALTQALNGQPDRAVWQLERLSADASGGQVRGIWRGRLP